MKKNRVRISAAFVSFSLALSLGILSCLPASPQEPAFTKMRGNQPGRLDVSPPIREPAPAVAPLSHGPRLVHSVLKPKAQKLAAAGVSAAQDAALQTSTGNLVSANIGLNLLGVGIGFNGYVVPDAPTDVNLAVGDTQVVQWVNVSYAVFDKASGAVIAGPIAGNQFWAGFGGACETQNDGDIIAQWDKVAHRWLMAQNVFSAPYMTCVAVSATPDATGPFFRYAFPQPFGFPDYPKWGIWTEGSYQHT